MNVKFGTSGWRAIIGKEFTVDNLCIASQAIANYLKRHRLGKKGIIISHDTRFMGDYFSKISASILETNNIPVLLTKRDTPTPVIAFQVIHMAKAGAINITASHNPPEYSGIKFSVSNGGPAPTKVTKEIEKEIIKIKNSSYKTPDFFPQIAHKDFKPCYPKKAYFKQLSKLIDLDIIKKSRLNIAIDCMHGTSRNYLDSFLQTAGITPIVINKDLNPLFEGHGPDPKPENLLLLRKTVLKNSVHLGLATDGDADRFGIIDSDGTFITSNQVLALIFEHLIKTRRHKGGIVKTITTTNLLNAIAEKNNRDIFEVPVGFKYVGNKLLEKNAVMGGEESGGMTVAGHIPEKDGILACMLITELAATRKKPLKHILRDIHKKYGYFYNKRIDISTTSANKKFILRKIKQSPFKTLAGISVKNHRSLKGNNFKFTFSDNSWIMIRPSGTEPIIRCYTETLTKIKLKKLEKALRQYINQ